MPKICQLIRFAVKESALGGGANPEKSSGVSRLKSNCPDKRALAAVAMVSTDIPGKMLIVGVE